jgi:hypothetical protein
MSSAASASSSTTSSYGSVVAAAAAATIVVVGVLLTFLANADDENMYFHQAMKAPVRDELIKAIAKEINDHIVNTHWELVPRSDVPNGKKNLDYVWAMRRKRYIKTQKVLKYKAGLNVNIGQH